VTLTFKTRDKEKKKAKYIFFPPKDLRDLVLKVEDVPKFIVIKKGKGLESEIVKLPIEKFHELLVDLQVLGYVKERPNVIIINAPRPILEELIRKWAERIEPIISEERKEKVTKRKFTEEELKELEKYTKMSSWGKVTPSPEIFELIPEIKKIPEPVAKYAREIWKEIDEVIKEAKEGRLWALLYEEHKGKTRHCFIVEDVEDRGAEAVYKERSICIEKELPEKS